MMQQPGISPDLDPKPALGIAARVLISAGLAWHFAALLAGAFAASPSSPLQRSIARAFAPYNSLVHQGFGFRYYSRLDATTDPAHPRRWGTPVVTLKMHFDDGRPPEEVRLPDEAATFPGLRHQRRLNLAYHLAGDPRWAASYARHLVLARGCQKVEVTCREHSIPPPGDAGRGEGTFSEPYLLGTFRWDEL